jgi:hypothetical protein
MLKEAIAGFARMFSSGGGHVACGSATGRVWVGDRTHELDHAYAFDATGDGELWVCLTDAPLTDKQVSKRFGVHDATRAGQVHGVKLRLDPTDSDPKSLRAVLLMPPASKSESLTSISASGSRSQFERLSLPPAPLSGRIRYEQEAIFQSPPYGFDVEFEFPPEPGS